MRKIYFMVLFTLAFVTLFGQQQDNKPALMAIAAPSPDAAALGKYGQYPVSMCNGLVQIDIPIHTIKLPLATVPISISYHASGIKVDDISSTVGLGWALNAGGVITRSVKGMPDMKFGSSGIIHSKVWVDSNLSGDGKISYLWNAYSNDKNGSFDSESDVYYYNVCGLSGSFRFDIDGNLIQIPLSNNRIEFIQGRNIFQITGTDGTIYSFEATENSYQNINSGYVPYTSSWYLSWIKTTDGQEVDFTYKEDKTFYIENYMSFWLKVPHNTPNNSIVERSGSYNKIDRTLLPESIVFPEGSVWFNYNDDRVDRRRYRLTGIDIKDKQSKLVKAFSLEQTCFSPSGTISISAAKSGYGDYNTNLTCRLKLEKVSLLNSQRTTVGNYNFYYNTSVSLPTYFDYATYQDAYKTQNVYPYFGQDEWGYYNGVRTNSNSFIYKCDQSYGLNKPQADRSVNSTYAQACILNKISYPTGGATEFEYEGNKNNLGENTGGLRIKTVKSYSAQSSDAIIHSYQYSNGLNNITGWRRMQGSSYTQGEAPGIVVNYFDYYFSQPNLPLTYSGGNSVFYTNVTEYEGYPDNSNGKTEHSFLYSSNDVDYFPENFNIYALPKASYKFIPRFDYLFIDRGWTRGNPTCEKVYNKKNGVFSLVKQTDYEYKTFNKQKKVVGFKSFANYGQASRYFGGGSSLVYNTPEEGFQYADIPVETGLVKLSKTTETSYSNGNAITRSTSYSYDRLNNQYEVTSTQQTNSDGSVLKKSFTYPKDINLTVYNTMVNLNMLSPVVITKDSINNTFLQEAQTNYNSWLNTFVAPSSFTIKRGTGETQTVLSYQSYDSKGNLMYAIKNNADKVVYLWSYNYQYPVVEIKGATIDEVRSVFGYTKDSQFESFSSLQYPTNDQVNTVGTSLRNYFQGKPVLVTTYTYKPLVGMTSMTDPSGVTTSYEYDLFGRLIYVKDNNGKVVNKYEYNYKQ